jgi:hypothetical protein
MSSSPSPVHLATGMGNFKSLFAKDLKVRPTESPKKGKDSAGFNPKHSILYKRSESVDKSIQESKGLSTLPPTPALAYSMTRQSSYDSAPGSPPLRRAASNMSGGDHDFIHTPLHSMTTAKKNKKETQAEVS